MNRREATFARRGFHVSSDFARDLLECSGFSFLEGYNAAVECGYSSELISRLEAVEAPFRGFAYEGAAMGLKLIDGLSPFNRDHFGALVGAEGSAHIYMLHVGAGLAMARLPWSPERLIATLDPLLNWLAFDGYGFHEGFFHWKRRIMRQRLPRGLQGYRSRVFDQGLGRSLWYVEGAQADRIIGTISNFPASRQADLWAGIGLASGYAGGMEQRGLEELAAASGSHRGALAQGAAFAAKARLRAGNPVSHTETVCQVFCATTAVQAAAVTDSALRDLEAPPGTPAYALWRTRIQRHFSAPQATA